MTSRHKLIGLLTATQSEILKELFSLYQQCGDSKFWKPRDLGAYRSSHHALTLRRLASQGLVDSVELMGATSTKKYAYRISDRGVETWELIIAVATLPLTSIFGGKSAQRQMQELVRLVQ
ncbi:MAG: hypothetical protein Q7S87_08945 [Agitococcus sp.]|nr:hypothetical protein [Agitococcus sp.]MDO9177027.1 hypothetical protein [Agitococcus sp.]